MLRYFQVILVIAGLLVIAAFFYWPLIDIYAGDSWLKEHDYTRAIKSYTGAINSRLKGRTLASAYFGRANARSDLAYAALGGDAAFVAALDDYTKAIKLSPDEPNYYRERGSIYTYLGAYPEAFADFDAIRRFEGDKPMWSLVRKGGLQRRLDNYQGALKSFQTVLKAWKGVPLMPPNFHMALTYMRMEKYRLAVEALDRGMKAQPDYSWAFFTRACAKANLGRYREALDDYQHGFDLYVSLRPSKPRYPSTKHNIKIIREERKFLQDIVDKRIDPDKEQLKKLCFRDWWDLHFNKRRERSPLLPK